MPFLGAGIDTAGRRWQMTQRGRHVWLIAALTYMLAVKRFKCNNKRAHHSLLKQPPSHKLKMWWIIVRKLSQTWHHSAAGSCAITLPLKTNAPLVIKIHHNLGSKWTLVKIYAEINYWGITLAMLSDTMVCRQMSSTTFRLIWMCESC